MAHTPAPWIVEQILDRFNVYIAAQECVCIARDCTKADARLIAASPDLLAALQGVLRLVNWDMDEFVAARAAIAAATGATP